MASKNGPVIGLIFTSKCAVVGLSSKKAKKSIRDVIGLVAFTLQVLIARANSNLGYECFVFLRFKKRMYFVSSMSEPGKIFGKLKVTFPKVFK